MPENELLPGEELVNTLETLRKKLLRSSVERTAGLREAVGVDCSFYLKSLRVFIRRDYKEIRDLVEQANVAFAKCEEELPDG